MVADVIRKGADFYKGIKDTTRIIHGGTLERFSKENGENFMGLEMGLNRNRCACIDRLKIRLGLYAWGGGRIMEFSNPIK